LIVVDASALVELLLRGPAAQSLEQRLVVGNSLHAPELLDLEVTQVLRRHEARRQVDPSRCREALDDLTSISLLRHPHTHLLPRIWELRHNISAYDAVYVALAEYLDAPLLTRDRRLASAAGHSARIDLV
jgi:predicted nucleic acid-binding protein